MKTSLAPPLRSSDARMSPFTSITLRPPLPVTVVVRVTECSVCVGASDYSTKLYSYDDGEADPDLTRFSIEHDREYILPMLRQAGRVNPDLFLFSTPWSPPGWMKFNNSMLGGAMRNHYLPVYAQYYLKFLQAYAAEGVPVQALTSQNELDTDQDGIMPACIWPQEYEIQFVRDHLGPQFHEAGIKSKILIFDHNWDLIDFPIKVISDPKAASAADRRGQPMQFELLREGPAEACGSSCGAWVSAISVITADTPDAFERFAEQHPFVDHRPADIRAEQRELALLGEEREHVDRDQRVRHTRDLRQLAHAHHLRTLVGALRAAHPDRRGGHAVGTDRPPAVRAGDPRLARGVAIAGGHVLAAA